MSHQQYKQHGPLFHNALDSTPTVPSDARKRTSACIVRTRLCTLVAAAVESKLIAAPTRKKSGSSFQTRALPLLLLGALSLYGGWFLSSAAGLPKHWGQGLCLQAV